MCNLSIVRTLRTEEVTLHLSLTSFFFNRSNGILRFRMISKYLFVIFTNESKFLIWAIIKAALAPILLQATAYHKYRAHSRSCLRITCDKYDKRGKFPPIPHGTRDRRPDRKSTRLNSSHVSESRMPSSA